MNYSRVYQGLMKAYSFLPKAFMHGRALWPIQVYVEVTYACNLDCDFCQFAGNRAVTECEWSVKMLAEALGQLRPGGIVSFTGGEPFVKKDFMKLLQGVSKAHRTHVFTNGSLITEKTAAELVSLGAGNILDRGLVLIGVSLEGLEKTHNRVTGRPDAYQRTTSAIQALVRHKKAQRGKYPLIEVKTVISENNVGDLHALSRLARGLGADLFNPMIMNTIPHEARLGNTSSSPLKVPAPVQGVDLSILREQLSGMERESKGVQIRTTPQGIRFKEIIAYYENRFPLEGFTCRFPWHGLGITACGDVVLCPYAKIGNLKDQGLQALFNNERARAFRQKLKKYRVFPGCLGCCNLVR